MTVYNDKVSQYIQDLFVHPDTALQWALDDSITKNLPTINVKPEEGRFLQVLVAAANVLKAVEIGTLGGYSGIWIARGLPAGGRLITLEKDPRHAEISRSHFEKAGVADRIEIRLGDAKAILQSLIPAGPFDFVFIDADKDGYDTYLDWALQNVRLGGTIAAHNAFRKGSVAGTAPSDDFTETMQAFNRRVAADPRLLSTIYPAGDGMVISVRIA